MTNAGIVVPIDLYVSSVCTVCTLVYLTEIAILDQARWIKP
jgi:hypothetical protein